MDPKVGRARASGQRAGSLSAASQSIASTQADAGTRVTRTLGGFHPFVSAMCRRELTDGRTKVSLRLGDPREGGFDVEGLRFAHDTVAAEAGFTVFRRSIGMSLSYEMRRAHQQMRHVVQFAIGFQ